jgi:phenylpropionate dioxygenase-like ring-hydroxylating dioxygenase large terminal subunit
MTTEVTAERQAPARFRPGSYALRDAWFPLIQTAQIGRRPVRRLIHGQPVIFWRRDGELQATEHVPNATGPRLRTTEFTGGTGHYPLVQRYGYAWVWYGDPANASPDLIPSVPHLPAEGMPRRMQGNVVFDCTYELVCENLLDLTHADFLHSAVTGDALSEDDEIFVDSTSETVTMTRIAHGRAIPKMQRGFVKGATQQNLRVVTITHVRSGVCVLHGDFNPGMDMRMLHPVNPETPNRCRTPVMFNPESVPWYAKAFIGPAFAHMVGRQDNWALRNQNSSYVQPRPNSDLSSRFDKAGLRYRKVFQALVARQQEGDYSYQADGDPARDVREELGLLGRI